MSKPWTRAARAARAAKKKDDAKLKWMYCKTPGCLFILSQQGGKHYGLMPEDETKVCESCRAGVAQFGIETGRAPVEQLMSLREKLEG